MNNLFILTTLQTKMKTWLDVRSTVLDEMVTLDGPGNNRLDSCGLCGSSQATPLYHCLECSYGLLYCGECILKSHTMSPLHRLEVCLHFPYCIPVFTVSSVGKMDSLRGCLFIPLDMSVILDMVAARAPQSPLPANSPSLISTVGRDYK